ARARLVEAQAQFSRMRGDVRSLGPILPLAKLVPVLRQQVRGVEVFSDSGLLLSDAGLRLDGAAAGILEPTDQRLKVSAALATLRKVHVAMQAGVKSLDKAAEKVRSLDGYNLFGPLGDARADLARRLPVIQKKAQGAESGLGALIAFAGGSGPKRYLVLSQNPDEVRPTGGFIGTYGVLLADGAQVRLERYDSIDSWTRSRPDATVPAEKAGIAFLSQTPPANQNLGNVNSLPDWPSAARLAMDLWQRGGEAPVDGVVSFTPGLLGRILGVTGPVTVPSYGENVSASNLDERLDFYTHSEEALKNPNRKDFVAALAEVTLQRLLESPASQWDALARAVGASLDNQQAMAWARDPGLEAELARRRWDGAFPATRGDFFAAGEFAYTSKNGKGLRRTYDHLVSLRPDGSARITTTMTIENTKPAGILNRDSLSYITVYGPSGGVLAKDGDDPGVPESELAGHPAFAWFRAAEPLGQTTLKVAWDAPDVAHKNPDGSWVYGLWFRRIVDHSGDVLNLKVDLPPGWRWRDQAPPARVDLNRDVIETWAIRAG
nr:DUF4012 domain-containing protein [Actinomycetota bacterium]